MTTSDVALLSLHGLRLKGFAAAADVAELYGLETAPLAAQLASQEADSLVVHRGGPPTGWRLTPSGRRENERLLARELERTGARPSVAAAYERFHDLNDRVQEVCTRWQVRDQARGTLNDHRDPRYDQAVVGALLEIDRDRQPVTSALAAALGRFGIHGPRLDTAREQLLAGDLDWFTRPVLASYHTVWFELHEDLLATLGIDRASERAARSAATPGDASAGPAAT